MTDREDRFRDWLLPGLAFATGALDAWSYLGFGGVFTANMTGNLVLLAIDSGARDLAHAARCGLALAAYAIGVAVGARLAGARTGDPWPPRVARTLAIETALLVALGLTWTFASGARSATASGACVALGALAMGMQGSAILTLGVAGVPTTYETGVATTWLRRLVRPEVAPDGWVRPATLGAVALGAATSVGAWHLARPLIAWLPVALVAIVLVVARLRFGRRGGPAGAAQA